MLKALLFVIFSSFLVITTIFKTEKSKILGYQRTKDEESIIWLRKPFEGFDFS